VLFDYINKYQSVKETRCVQEALDLYGKKIMMLAEKYQNFLQIDLQN